MITASLKKIFVLTTLEHWFDNIVLDLGRQLRWSFAPPLMVYLAAGISGLTAIVGAFFVKDYLGLSASFLAGLAFWAGIPWALKMPLGHLVDVIWYRKSTLVYLGALLVTVSLLIMYALLLHTRSMIGVASAEIWYVLSALLAPLGYVLQDVVADAMTVEAVPLSDEHGVRYSEPQLKQMHTTMQTLGRFAILSGLAAVAALNIFMFEGVAQMNDEQKVAVYANIYLFALVIPAISVAGVVLGTLSLRLRARRLRAQGLSAAHIDTMLRAAADPIAPDWRIIGGSLAFIAFVLGVGLGNVPYAQELTFCGSMLIVMFLMSRLIRELKPNVRKPLIGTAVIIFVFRAVPLPGPGVTWFEIDVLRFDEQFLSVLSLITAALALVGMLLLRPLLATRSIAFVVALLTIVAGLLSLPNIGLYYGLADWSERLTQGIVDARFIAILDTALESPLAQISMIPMLAWIAKNAPAHLKATFFAVMASFSNLALSASSLGTKYMNHLFVVTREVRDPTLGTIETAADYSELGGLLIVVVVLGVSLPLLVIALVQHSSLRTQQ